MSNAKSGFWIIALPLSVAFLGAAYYIKVPEVRNSVDERTPIVRNLLGRFISGAEADVAVQSDESAPHGDTPGNVRPDAFVRATSPTAPMPCFPDESAHRPALPA